MVGTTLRLVVGNKMEENETKVIEVVSIFPKKHLLRLTLTTILLIGIVFIVGVIARYRPKCDIRMDRLLEGPGNGVAIFQREEICGGFAFSDQVSLDFLNSGSAVPATIFSYTADGNYPSVLWKDNNTLTVKISHIYEISRQVWSIQGIKVEYEIESVGE